MIAECIALVAEVWNPYGSQDIKFLGGVGAMRDRKGEVMAESLIQTDHWEFKVGFRPPIWCIWDGEKLTLTKYSARYKDMQERFNPPSVSDCEECED
jgi:hypothetical protein